MSRIVKGRPEALPPGEYRVKVIGVTKEGDRVEILYKVEVSRRLQLSHFLRGAPARRDR